MSLIDVPPLAVIMERLPIIFPEGTEHRNYLIREMAAKTIFVMFYAGAVDSIDRWIRPSQITDMTDEQAALLNNDDRNSWVKLMLSNKKKRPVNSWYASNSREPIRDETIRTGLIPLQAVTVRSGIPTTSSKPTYALQQDFSQLFDVTLIDDHLLNKIDRWQKNYLSKAAITRLILMKSNLANDSSSVQITFPDGAIRTLEAGPSSLISKAVIEEFAPRFLKQPHVLWLSESGNKVVAQDEVLAKALGLQIDASRALPDIILVDLGDEKTGTDMLVIFTEVVASDGPINRQRKEVLTALAEDAGFDQKHLAFLTAFSDRSAIPFKKCITDLAWGSYAWFSTEPDHIIDLRETSTTVKLSTLRLLS